MTHVYLAIAETYDEMLAAAPKLTSRLEDAE